MRNPFYTETEPRELFREPETHPKRIQLLQPGLLQQQDGGEHDEGHDQRDGAGVAQPVEGGAAEVPAAHRRGPQALRARAGANQGLFPELQLAADVVQTR